MLSLPLTSPRFSSPFYPLNFVFFFSFKTKTETKKQTNPRSPPRQTKFKTNKQRFTISFGLNWPITPGHGDLSGM